MEYYRNIQDAIDYIEVNLFSNISLEKAAQVACMSLKHLYRMFYSVVGCTIKDYIRKRQVSCAANEIKSTEKKITDIALDNGFSTHQSFCKIFKKITGVSPKAYKTTKYYYSFEAFNVDIAEKYYNDFNVQIINRKTFQTVGFSYKSESKIGIEKRAIDFMNYFFRDSFNVNQEYRYFGSDCDTVFRDGGIFYWGYNIMIDTVMNINIPSDYLLTLPNGDKVSSFIAGPQYGGLYAVYNLSFDDDMIQNSWNTLYNQWLPQSTFLLGKHRYFEEYFLKKDTVKKVSLYMPIQKKEKDYQIAIEKLPKVKAVVCRKYGNNAESEAANTLMDYLTQVINFDIGNIFYTRSGIDEKGNWHECAVPMPIATMEIVNFQLGIQTKTILGGTYAKITSFTFKNTDIMLQKLNKFVHDNSNLDNCGQWYAEYRVEDWYEYTKNIQLTCYLSVKEKSDYEPQIFVLNG